MESVRNVFLPDPTPTPIIVSASAGSHPANEVPPRCGSRPPQDTPLAW